MKDLKCLGKELAKPSIHFTLPITRQTIIKHWLLKQNLADLKFTTLWLPICFLSLSLPQMLRLRRIFPTILRKSNALPICFLLFIIFKSLQKLTFSSAANVYCLWKQSQLTFYKKKKLICFLESTESICIVLLHCFAYKKEFFGTTEALSLLCSLFFSPPALK